MVIEGTHYSNQRSFLLKKWDEKRLNNPAFSLRAYANYLQISKTSLCDVLNGKRNLSRKNMLKLCERFNLSPEEIEIFLKLGQNGESNVNNEEERLKILALEEDEFHFISDWHHYAVLSLSNIPDNKADPKWIAKQLGIQIQDAKLSVERLMRLGLIKIEKGKLVNIHDSLVSTNLGIPSAAVRKHHQQLLKRAENSLFNDPIEVRDFSSITFAGSLKNIEEARKVIQKFRRKILKVMGNNQSNEDVFSITVQLFPQTKIDRSHP